MDVRFELTTAAQVLPTTPYGRALVLTTAAQVLSTTPYGRALVRYTTGTSLTHRLPKLNLITLSSFVVQTARVHSIYTSKNQCTCYCGLPATYTLRTTC